MKENSDMKDPKELAKGLTGAARERDSQALLIINRLSCQEKVELRDALGIEPVTREDRERLIQWAWHEDLSIQQAVRILILLVGADLAVACFERFLSGCHLSPPFELDYNTSEYEFSVDLPQTPGFGVSHYGRDDKAIDRILLVLERTYQRTHPEQRIAGFRS